MTCVATRRVAILPTTWRPTRPATAATASAGTTGIAAQALAFVLAFGGGLALRPNDSTFEVVQTLYVACLLVGMAAVVTLMLASLRGARRGDGLLVYFGLRAQPPR